MNGRVATNAANEQKVKRKECIKAHQFDFREDSTVSCSRVTPFQIQRSGPHLMFRSLEFLVKKKGTRDTVVTDEAVLISNLPVLLLHSGRHPKAAVAVKKDPKHGNTFGGESRIVRSGVVAWFCGIDQVGQRV